MARCLTSGRRPGALEASHREQRVAAAGNGGRGASEAAGDPAGLRGCRAEEGDDARLGREEEVQRRYEEGD
eukprot:643387-Hanusia_phi.AAC.1